MYSIELMKMIKDQLDGKYNTNEFSYDFPDRLQEVYDEFLEENKELCDYLEDELPELCSWYDPHGTGDDDTLNDKEFNGKLKEIYEKALPMVLLAKQKKIS